MLAKDYRKNAAMECQPFTVTLIFIYLVVYVLSLILGGLSFIPFYIGLAFSTVILLVIGGPLEFSFIDVCQKVKRDDEPDVRDIFNGFYRFVDSFIVYLLKTIFIFLWSLLLVVPGIIKSLSYFCAIYLAHDNKDMPSLAAIDKSKELMEGRKWRLFCLDISYIGWFLLCLLTLGVLFLWVMPKFRQARYNFYLDILKETNTEIVK